MARILLIDDDADFSRFLQLSLEQQGLFALGYYHQRQDFYKRQENTPGNGDGESE